MTFNVLIQLITNDENDLRLCFYYDWIIRPYKGYAVYCKAALYRNNGYNDDAIRWYNEAGEIFADLSSDEIKKLEELFVSMDLEQKKLVQKFSDILKFAIKYFKERKDFDSLSVLLARFVSILHSVLQTKMK